MKKKSGFIFSAIGIILSSLVFLYILYTGIVYLQCYSSAKNIPQYHFREHMRIMIYGSSVTEEGNTISAKISIVDTTGNSIAVIERSWSGSYLAVEMNQFEMAGKTFLFPSKIYGKNKILENRNFHKKYTNLEKYYNENGLSLLLGNLVPKTDRRDLCNISRFATKKVPVIDFGFTDTFVIDLSNCVPNRYYSICTNAKGGIDIIAD